MSENPTRRARVACANWLADCVKAGWGKDSLDGLESLWWEHHDHTGELLAPKAGPLVEPAPGHGGQKQDEQSKGWTTSVQGGGVGPAQE